MRLVQFFRRELAPAPGRLRATLRILAGCWAAMFLTAVVGLDMTSHAHWTIFTIFTVSQADAGASLRKSIQRVLGTLIGGALGILVVVALADLPVLYTPVLGLVVALGMFASVTTTASYVMLLGTVTFVLVAFLPPHASASTAVHDGLWRIVAITLGVVCGTGAQLFLWPEDPEDKLRIALAGRLAVIAATLRAIVLHLDGGDAVRSDVPRPRLVGDEITSEIDLLANAEARHPALRQRHTEQLALIVEVDRLITTAVWLVDVLPRRRPMPGADLAVEVRALGLECEEMGEALAAGRPALPSRRADETTRADGSAIPGLRPTLDDMWLAISRTRAALGFLDPAQPMAPALDRPTRRPLLTPAFSVKNLGAISLALKAAIGAVISYVLMHALSWDALLTAAVTCVLVAQTSVGATVQKSLLRLGGALLGGALGIAVIVVAMPNLENLAGLMAVAGLGFAGASWIAAGGPRISYMGLQIGMAFAMCVTDPSGPTTNLTVGRDRVLGILVGVLVMMFVDVLLSPVRARLSMRPTLARALRSIAKLARYAPTTQDYRARLGAAVGLRSAVYGDLAATLRLSDESTLEPDADTAEARQDREWAARLVGHAQAVFLAVLALIRHRLSPGFPTLPPAVQEGMRALDEDVAVTLDALAEVIDRGPERELPDLPARLADVDARVSAEEPPVAGGATVAAYVAERDHLAIARDLVHQVAILRDALAPAAR